MMSNDVDFTNGKEMQVMDPSQRCCQLLVQNKSIAKLFTFIYTGK